MRDFGLMRVSSRFAGLEQLVALRGEHTKLIVRGSGRGVLGGGLAERLEELGGATNREVPLVEGTRGCRRGREPADRPDDLSDDVERGRQSREGFGIQRSRSNGDEDYAGTWLLVVVDWYTDDRADRSGGFDERRKLVMPRVSKDHHTPLDQAVEWSPPSLRFPLTYPAELAAALVRQSDLAC
jgi:hypothetical protein